MFPFLAVGMAKSNKKQKIDWYIITRVREMRMKANLGQENVALHLEVSTGYIGHIESPNFSAKYTTTQINELAKLFKCSPKDFMPEKPL
jgi:transcriptional regulator with XRE-family HTH domain